jgi:hypothetical protein
MSLFGGGSKTVYVPQAPANPVQPTPAPPPPTLTSKDTVAASDAAYLSMARARPGSYASTILGGSAPAPKKSYSSALFSGGGL